MGNFFFKFRRGLKYRLLYDLMRRKVIGRKFSDRWLFCLDPLLQPCLNPFEEFHFIMIYAGNGNDQDFQGGIFEKVSAKGPIYQKYPYPYSRCLIYVWNIKNNQYKLNFIWTQRWTRIEFEWMCLNVNANEWLIGIKF